MPPDTFSSNTTGLTSPATKHFNITPHDTNELATKPRGIYVGVAGDVVLTDEAGTDCTYKNASGVLPVRAVKVKATGTTATNLIGIY